MDEPNRRQDNNIGTLIVPVGKVSCGSSGGESADTEYTIREQVVSARNVLLAGQMWLFYAAVKLR